ncbi:citrate/2-methylcitrate synthase [Desulfatibacillum aliphaticivorans]|uniref:citrate/2-methylcitrate synthase n=1 Tax=Desulfatibacillum aliphaticivorans TaxID=218208 RepID=UPI00041F8B76|nr:citrate/2-methylcitrate synthase [Desulfatibacillum aliphaticivorans]
MSENVDKIKDLILEAAEKAKHDTAGEPTPETPQKLEWPIQATLGPGLEGAIACETNVGYVNGAKGWLVYRGYDIFDLAANCTYEETAYLLLHGELPNPQELHLFKKKFLDYKDIRDTQRLLMSFPIEDMHPMAALRFGVGLLRQKQTYRDKDKGISTFPEAVSSDDDSIAMETIPMGEKTATYVFPNQSYQKLQGVETTLLGSEDVESCYHLIAGLAAIAATVARIRSGHLPLEPDPSLSHAGNLLYMMTGRKPTPVEERIMDVSLILHADHGMNASTFASMVVASTLSDIYFAVDAGVADLSGPLHGGANEQALLMLQEIGGSENVNAWYKKAVSEKRKIMGIGHRVYKTYDPRARILGPMAEFLAKENSGVQPLMETAKALEKQASQDLGEKKNLFPNVDFYSGLVYHAMGVPSYMFTPLFAVSRVAGWTSRILEYLDNNRIFRPRASYTGSFGKSVQDFRQSTPAPN